MSRDRLGHPARSILTWIAIVTTVIAFTGWCALKGKFKTASMEEVRAALPSELLKREADDEAGQQRYIELVDLIRQLGQSETIDTDRTSPVVATLHSKNDEFWRAKSMIRARMVSLLNEGPIQCPSMELRGDVTWLPPMSIYWFLSMALSRAKLFSSNRNFDDCTL